MVSPPFAMDSLDLPVFVRIFPPPAAWSREDMVWINPSRVAKVEYLNEPNCTIEQVVIFWSAAEALGPLVSPKLTKFRKAELLDLNGQQIARGTHYEVLINSGAVWAIQACANGTRLHLAQTESTLKSENGILVLRIGTDSGRQVDSTAARVAEELSIQLEGVEPEAVS